MYIYKTYLCMYVQTKRIIFFPINWLECALLAFTLNIISMRFIIPFLPLGAKIYIIHTIQLQSIILNVKSPRIKLTFAWIKSNKKMYGMSFYTQNRRHILNRNPVNYFKIQIHLKHNIDYCFTTDSKDTMFLKRFERLRYVFDIINKNVIPNIFD